MTTGKPLYRTLCLLVAFVASLMSAQAGTDVQLTFFRDDVVRVVKDGMVGFYDKVAEKMYLPSAGTFAAGPVKKKPGLVIFIQ